MMGWRRSGDFATRSIGAANESGDARIGRSGGHRHAQLLFLPLRFCILMETTVARIPTLGVIGGEAAAPHLIRRPFESFPE